MSGKTIINKEGFKIRKDTFSNGDIMYYTFSVTTLNIQKVIEEIVETIERLEITLSESVDYWSKRELAIFKSLGCTIKTLKRFGSCYPYKVLSIGPPQLSNFDRHQLF